MRRTSILLPLLVLFLALLSSCEDKSREKETVPEAKGTHEKGVLTATLETSAGDIEIELYAALTPLTVENFLALAEGRKEWRDPMTGKMAKRPFYDGQVFFKIMPGLLIQAGDPTGKGDYNPGYFIPDEFDPALKHDRPGVVAMATENRPDSGSCQFYITLRPMPFFDGKYPVFGQVIGGLDVLEKIGGGTAADLGKPRPRVTIKSVRISR